MKKILTILCVITLFVACEPAKTKVRASKNIFSIVLIEPLKDDSSRIYSKYHIEMNDTLKDGSQCGCHTERVSFSIIDTNGKYDANDKLILTIQHDTTIHSEQP